MAIDKAVEERAQILVEKIDRLSYLKVKSSMIKMNASGGAEKGLTDEQAVELTNLTREVRKDMQEIKNIVLEKEKEILAKNPNPDQVTQKILKERREKFNKINETIAEMVKTYKAIQQNIEHQG